MPVWCAPGCEVLSHVQLGLWLPPAVQYIRHCELVRSRDTGSVQVTIAHTHTREPEIWSENRHSFSSLVVTVPQYSGTSCELLYTLEQSEGHVVHVCMTLHREYPNTSQASYVRMLYVCINVCRGMCVCVCVHVCIHMCTDTCVFIYVVGFVQRLMHEEQEVTDI